MIKKEDCLLLIIDVQDKLVKMLGESNLPNNVYAVTKACEILDVPTIVTEQYPKGLGETIPLIKDANSKAIFFEKTSFSALKNDVIKEKIKSFNKKQIFICGIEAHICVLQTALELQQEGYEVYFINDCSASRHKNDYDTAVSYLKQKNISVISKEILIFSLLETSRHPNFKEVQSLIK